MFTLAIETAICGGSLSLMKDDLEIDAWIGNKSVSKAEDVLEQISKMFARNRIKKIDLISVSTGPGSSTGIRIGLATALGLKKSFNCRIAGVSVFEALIFNKIIVERTLIALPLGSRQIAWQIFEKDEFSRQPKQPTSEINIGNTSYFQKLLSSQELKKIILHSELVELVLSSDEELKSPRTEIIEERLAAFIGLKGKHNSAQNLKDRNLRNASDNIKIIYPTKSEAK